MIELKLITDFPQEIIAVDEVGRSPLSGPVVVGAIRLFANNKEDLATLLRSLRRCKVKDSKTLTTEARQEILGKLNVRPLAFREKGRFEWKGISITHVTWEMDHDVIDRENILNASLRAMREGATFLTQNEKSMTTVLIDGPMGFRWNGEEPFPWKELPLTQGDAKSSLIGLASIIAKEKRDSWMREMHLLYPQYGLDTNYGYPTKEHRLAIEKFGPSPIHRKSFAKVKEFVRGE